MVGEIDNNVIEPDDALLALTIWKNVPLQDVVLLLKSKYGKPERAIFRFVKLPEVPSALIRTVLHVAVVPLCHEIRNILLDHCIIQTS